MARKREGLEVRHQSKCSKRRGGSSCTCTPSYRTSVWDAEANANRRSPWTKSKAEALRWRSETQSAKHRRQLGPINGPTIDGVASQMFEAMQTGLLPTRSGKAYKGSTIRGYKLHYRNEIEPTFGSLKADQLDRKKVQRLVDQLAKDRSPSSVRNALMPLRLIIRYARQRDLINSYPFKDIQLPAKNEKPTRILSIAEARSLVAALSGRDKAIFMTALYAGLRLGELRALRWHHIDFEMKTLRVERSWDRFDGEISPKSQAGNRTIPLVRELSQTLSEMRADEDDDDLVLGRGTRPFGPQSLYKRIDKALEPFGLEGTRLQDCRHFFASVLIASGANVKEVQVWMGHSSVQITLNRYGHLFGGGEARAADRFSQYLESECVESAR